MILEHVAAFVALVDAVPNVTVYADGEVPNKPTYPYIVVYANQGVPEVASAHDVSNWRTFTIQTTKVGLSRTQVQALADREEPALLDVRPVVVGRSCGQISKSSSQPIRPDRDVTPSVFYAVDVWTFFSVPA